MINSRELKGFPPAYGGCTCSCHRVSGVMHVAACCRPPLVAVANDAPERLWLGAADAENEHEVWFDPDEGGTPYLRADLALPDVDKVVDAVMDADRYAPKIVPMGANPPLFDGMQTENDGPWVSRVDVAKRLRAALIVILTP